MACGGCAVSNPYEAVAEVLALGGITLEQAEITAIVQAVLNAVDYSTAVVCPDCGAEVDTRTAEKL